MLKVARSQIPAVEKQPPLSWLPLKAGGIKSASFVCPNGHDGTLLDHDITASGTVLPSVVCNGIPGGESCDFHDYLELEAWSP